MSANFHPLVYIIDYILGVIMWTLIGRVAMNIFQREDSQFFFMKVFVKFTNPLINLFKPITPSFIIGPIVPLYVATYKGTMGPIMKDGVIGLNKLIKGFVNFTNTFIKKN